MSRRTPSGLWRTVYGLERSKDDSSTCRAYCSEDTAYDQPGSGADLINLRHDDGEADVFGG
jgi:hypothetical protein